MNFMKIRILVVGSILVISCHGVLTQDKELGDSKNKQQGDFSEIEIERATQKIESLAIAADKSFKKGVDPVEDTEYHYNIMTQIIDDIVYAVKDRTNAYKFINAKGLNRIVSANLHIEHTELRAKLLELLKVLFEVVPVTTNAAIPKNIIIRILDIFENGNLALKAHALDVLSKWLPRNPEIQIRVMKTKGLEPFYMQVNKLDISVIQTLLDLFNTILKEHVEARSEIAQKTKSDHDRQVLYQNIGLLERIESSNVCNGLVNIFQVVWAYNNKGEVVKTLLELIKNTKPFCDEILKGKNKAIVFLENVLKFVKNNDKQAYFDDIGLNTTDFEFIIQDYADKLKTDKDEF